MRSVVAADHDAGADGSSCEEHDDHVDDTCCGPNSGEGVGADEVSDDETVYGVVELLKKRPEQNREKEIQQLLPDHSLGDLVHGHPSADPLDAHAEIHSFFSKQADYSTTARGSR